MNNLLSNPKSLWFLKSSTLYKISSSDLIRFCSTESSLICLLMVNPVWGENVNNDSAYSLTLVSSLQISSKLSKYFVFLS